MVAFGWNAFVENKTIDWRLAKQSTAFVYLGADKTFLEAQADALQVGLKVGAYWSLQSQISPKDQVEVFLGRIGPVKGAHLPPAVWVYEAEHTPTLKAFVEALEVKTMRRTLIGGTPTSLKRAGFIFGRTNPLWISHKPLWGGPTIPQGWENFALWQSEPHGQAKGVSGEVGLNTAAPWFLDPGKEQKLALGLGALLLVGAGLYLYSERNDS